MNKISICQDNTKSERTQNNIVEYLYNLDNYETINNADISIVGNINVSHAYGDAVEYLTNKYNNFYITVNDGAYIRFKDAIVESTLRPLYSSDDIGITYGDAQNVLNFNNLEIPKTITSFDELQYFYVNLLGTALFKECPNLTSVNLKRVQQINQHCFNDDPQLTYIGDTSNIRIMGEAVFYNCNLTGDLNFPSLEYTFNAVFKNCINITSVTFGENYIGTQYYRQVAHQMFMGCTNLKHVYNIPNTITGVSSQAFENSGLEEFDFTNIIELGYNSFAGTNLTEFHMDHNFKTIDHNICKGCKKLVTASIKGTPEQTGDRWGIFENCSALVTADISGFTEGAQFSNCTSLETLTLSPIRTNNLGCRDCQKLHTINNLDKVVSIRGEGLYNCKSITELNIPNCTYIGERGLQGMELETLDISSVIELGNGALSHMDNLQTVTLSSQITSLPAGLFSYDKALTTVNMPNKPRSLGNEVFAYCDELTTFDVSAVQTMGNWTFAYMKKIKTLNFTSALTAISYQCFNGDNTLETVGDLSGVISIAQRGFGSCSSLTGPLDLSNCESIDNSAFSGCESLTSITLSSKCTLIKGNAFEGCTNLTSVGDLSGVETLGTHFANDRNVFYNCTKLESVNLSNKCTLAGWNTFKNCTSLTSVGDISGLTELHNSCFENCKSLTQNFELLTQTTIGDSVFSGCSSLTSVIIGEQVVKTGQYVFYNCPLLTVKFLSTIPPNQMAPNMFNGNILKVLVPVESVDAYKAKMDQTGASKVQGY